MTWRILAIHNRYRLRGGEDAVFEAEVALLRGAGHRVETLEPSNHVITGVAAKAIAAFGTIYSRSGRGAVAAAIAAFRPDIVHVHNFFPLLSPSVFDACEAANVPVVWTLHNFRVACANGLLFRDGAPCGKCLHGSAAWGAVHRCYRGSAAGSAVVAGMIGYHRRRGTWQRKVDRFIALSDFAAGRLVAAGLPAERLVVKPNFLPDPRGAAVAFDLLRTGALYVGRLSPEKGVRTLVDAWRAIDAPLIIVGEGPEEPALRRRASPNVTFVGWQDRADVLRLMAGAAVVIVPSLAEETFSMAMAEAMALATPVLASRRGAPATILRAGETGQLFEPGDSHDLARVANGLLADPVGTRRLGNNARHYYEGHLTSGMALERLQTIYREVLAERSGAPHLKRRA